MAWDASPVLHCNPWFTPWPGGQPSPAPYQSYPDPQHIFAVLGRVADVPGIRSPRGCRDRGAILPVHLYMAESPSPPLVDHCFSPSVSAFLQSTRGPWPVQAPLLLLARLPISFLLVSPCPRPSFPARVARPCALPCLVLSCPVLSRPVLRHWPTFISLLSPPLLLPFSFPSTPLSAARISLRNVTILSFRRRRPSSTTPPRRFEGQSIEVVLCSRDDLHRG